FVESVFNRAASRGQTLDTALHSIHIKKTQKGNFDPRTGAHADDPVSPEDQATWNGFIDRALAGSNVSGLSTGNQSPDKDPNFKLLPPRFDPHQKSKDTFVVEEQDQPWFNKTLNHQTRAINQGQPVTPDVELGPVNALKTVPAEPFAPRAQPVIPRAQPAHPTAQADVDDDLSDPMYQWPDA